MSVAKQLSENGRTDVLPSLGHTRKVSDQALRAEPNSCQFVFGEMYEVGGRERARFSCLSVRWTALQWRTSPFPGAGPFEPRVLLLPALPIPSARGKPGRPRAQTCFPSD